MSMTRKVKVRCSDRDGCGWSGERLDLATSPPTRRSCPKCGRRSVERVGRTNPTRQEA